MSTIMVGSTIPAFDMGGSDWAWWLTNAKQIRLCAMNAGHDVTFHATLQTDGRGPDPFAPLLPVLEALDGTYSTFSVDIGVERWDAESRLTGICMGRNLLIDRALRDNTDWIYFADSDIEAPDDVLVRLLEVNWPVCGANTPNYHLSGPGMDQFWNPYGHDLHTPQSRLAYHVARHAGEPWLARTQQHWNTAGALLVRRDVFCDVPWRFDPVRGLTDDPATQDAYARLCGYLPLVRHDVTCRHHPESIGLFDHRGLDLNVYR